MLLLFSFISLAGHSPGLWSQPDQALSPRYLAGLELHTKAELAAALVKVHDHFQQRSFTAQAPIVFVLHGPDAKALLMSRYEANRELMDMAARLSAFEMVDIRVCRTWMGGEGVDDKDLPPFISTVPFAPAEIERLLEQEGYVYF